MTLEHQIFVFAQLNKFVSFETGVCQPYLRMFLTCQEAYMYQKYTYYINF